MGVAAAAAIAQNNATARNNQPEASTIPPLALVFPDGAVPQQCKDKITKAAKAFRDSGSDQQIRKVFDFMSNQLCSIYLVLSSKQYTAAHSASLHSLPEPTRRQIDELLAHAIKAVAQQEGSSVGTGGSTNLTSKGIAAKFLSLASEYGALTESTSNMTTTVQGTLAGVPVVLLKKGLAEECSTKLLALTPCLGHGTLNRLNRVSYSVSFDSSQNGQSLTGMANGPAVANAQPATFKGNSHTINAVAGKVILIQGGKIDDQAVADALATFVKQSPSEGAKTRELATFFQSREQDDQGNVSPAFQTFQDAAVKQMTDAIRANAGDRQFVEIWKSEGTALTAALGVPETISPDAAVNNELILNTADFAVQYVKFLGLEEDAALQLSNKAQTPILTFEYDENRPASQPTNSVFRAIFQRKFTQVTLTANGAFSIYDSDPSSAIPGASRLRDIQVAGQADHNFQLQSAITGKIGMTLTGAYYFQHQSSPAILNVDPSSPVPGVSFTGLPANATQVFAQKGNISIGQVKLSVGSGSNIKVPISVTYSNRTELITKPTWRGQIGISYDFDSLFAK
jgi:DNA-binding transcriptional ArsR family regulator